MVLLLALSGCMMAPPPPPGTSTFATAALEGSDLSAVVESSVQEQALDSLMQTPTSFPIEYRADRHAWERARVFFDKYLSPPDQKNQAVVTKVRKETWILTNRDLRPSHFIYEVKRVDGRKGYTYSVSCEPVGNSASQDAQMNARNLARFIRDGSLEVSLLRR